MLFEKYELLVNPPQARWNEVVQLTHDELQWKMSFHDYQSYLDGYGRNHFKLLVAVDKVTDKAAACICGADFPSIDGSPQVFTIGMYYTHPDHRSEGLGRKLFEQLTITAKESNMFLNAAPDMAQKYAERSGFDKFAPWELKVMVAQAKDCDLTRLESDPKFNIVDFNHVNFEKLDEYDTNVCGGVHRTKFLKKFLTQPESYNKFAIDANDNVIGFCNARIVYGNHVVLGPFYADSPTIASTLFRQTLELVPHLNERPEVMVLLPHDNEEAVDMFSKMADGKVEIEMSMPRLFTKHVVHSPSRNVFSITEYDTNFV
ncbi:hypothetical protein QR680_016218 [Steinernema hermaphroditum]|uniref:N-acetyltransferase domain-containing protein n=1 Tax=Steinernema hermaphroditum TaxID=289476 RepID=A0AA39HAG2_9BILA|nr:hypothetical protein QR680_016218 [Steinernema hermaphroditum]